MDGVNWQFPGVPTGPEWRLDFAELVERFAWLRALGSCVQDTQWHAEGDVLTHTGMVMEALVAMSEWRALDAEARQIVFAGALLHDVGKPEKTREEGGRIRSKGHARAGASLARRIFMREMPEASFEAREAIVGLVRYHGVPAYFLDREDPERTVLRAGLTARLDWLSILATADARGRVMREADDMEARVGMFRDFAGELGCLTEPYRFANDHSRVAYFHSTGMRPDVALYDDCRCTVTVMSGLPAAGKDTWIARHGGDLPVVSLDDVRAEMGVEPGEEQAAVIAAAKEAAKGYLRKAHDFVWNATNTSRILRDNVIGLMLGYGARVRVVYCEAPLVEIFERNSRRTRMVPVAVMERLLERLEVPSAEEAHRVEYAVG
jgi:putative nucleotidyltransferase with HDIG domain